MDWNTLLKTQQTDFITRFKSDRLLHCEAIGQHSEKTIISGDRLKKLRDFCWDMAEKYKQKSSVRKTFINNLKGNLGEEVVKDRLGDLITDINYQVPKGGDGKIDFTLISNPNIGIQVKARHGDIDRVKWSITKEEVEKNTVLVCVLITEEVSEAESEYNLILAGFLPTENIDATSGKVFFTSDELLYSGGLRCYLESFINVLASFDDEFGSEEFYLDNDDFKSTNDDRASFDDEFGSEEFYLDNDDFKSTNNPLGDLDFESIFEKNDNEEVEFPSFFEIGNQYLNSGDYQQAIEYFNREIYRNPNNFIAYNLRGSAYYYLKDYHRAIDNYTSPIKLDNNYAIAYNLRADAYFNLKDYHRAIDDYTSAIAESQTMLMLTIIAVMLTLI